MIKNSLELDIPNKGSIINSFISDRKRGKFIWNFPTKSNEEKFVCLSTTIKSSIGSIEMECVFAFTLNGLIGMIVF